MKTLFLALGFFNVFLLAAQAGVPQPDNLIYGTIALEGRPIKSTNTNFSVEARRTFLGPALASYRMGTSPEAGDFLYVLRLPIESAPVQQSNSLEIGNSVFIVVKDDTGGIRAQQTFQVTSAGDAVRLDFGAAVDSNNNGIPDSWESTNGAGAGDKDKDGISDYDEYISGTNPGAANSYFNISMTLSGGLTSVSFMAQRAEGVGYEGRTRFYDLERTGNLLSGPWQVISNYNRIIGQNNPVTFQEPANTNTPAFFRGRVWLEGP